MTRAVCGLANKCDEAACPHRLPHDRNLLCDETCDMGPESKGCIGFVEYMTKIKLKGGKNIEPYNGDLPIKIFRKEVKIMEPIDRKYVFTATNPSSGGTHTHEDAMVFLAKDNALPATLRFYRSECEILGAATEQLKGIDLLIERVDRWRASNPEMCKVADIDSLKEGSVLEPNQG